MKGLESLVIPFRYVQISQNECFCNSAPSVTMFTRYCGSHTLQKHSTQAIRTGVHSAGSPKKQHSCCVCDLAAVHTDIAYCLAQMIGNKIAKFYQNMQVTTA